ncbi:hypothetical protein [Leptospira sp. GIMC2001]|uniref:hypothetical protein n=1 Tax=Leptospira sp. GIMC2001 TaxID=1513297 RepID=UPI00234B5F2D|nr:hypothetical protein [Leptospira sp. GIMC2001]WCL49011.1 hypothetical protein O4O04_17220 [Leptospira sp. GIMC2001]
MPLFLKRFILAIVLLSNANCLVFKESEFDPNSDFSNLLKLFAYLNRKTYEVTLELSYRNAGVPMAYQTFVTVAAVSENFELPEIIEERILDSPDYRHISGHFQSEKANFNITLATIGKYRLDYYTISGGITFHGSQLIEITDILNPNINILSTKLKISDHSITLIGIVRNELSDKRLLPGTEGIESIGYYDGKHYFYGSFLDPSKFTVHSNRYTVGYFSKIVWFDEQTSIWESVTIPNASSLEVITIDTSTTDEILISLSKPFYQDGRIHIYLTEVRRINIAGNTTENFRNIRLISFATGNSKELLIENISLRGLGKNALIDSNSFLFSGEFIYVENENNVASTEEYRRDNNFLRNGSTNSPIGNSTPDFTYFPGITLAESIFSRNGSLFRDLGGSQYRSLNSSFATVDGTYSHQVNMDASSAFNLYGNPYKFLLFESETNNKRYRITASNSDQTSGNILFEAANATSPKNYSSAISFYGMVFSSSRSFISINVDNTEPYPLIRLNHSNNQFTDISPIPTARIEESIPNFQYEFSDSLKDQCTLSEIKLLCVYQVRTQYSPNQSLGTYRSTFYVFTESTDGTNWNQYQKIEPVNN